MGIDSGVQAIVFALNQQKQYDLGKRVYKQSASNCLVTCLILGVYFEDGGTHGFPLLMKYHAVQAKNFSRAKLPRHRKELRK